MTGCSSPLRAFAALGAGLTTMKIPRVPHRWSLSPRAAVAVQRRLAARVVQAPPARELRFVAGLDAAFPPDGQQCLAAAVLLDLASLDVIEQTLAARPLRFPYVPGLLSFREAPALLAALRKLRHRPDVLMCDGQGLAHPRRFGIACHLGVVCDLPAIGCAKSRLVGDSAMPGVDKGNREPLTIGEECVGAVLRTRERTKPLFVSVGHRMDLDSACALVLAACDNHRLPEPTRLADRLVSQARLRWASPQGRTS